MVVPAPFGVRLKKREAKSARKSGEVWEFLNQKYNIQKLSKQLQGKASNESSAVSQHSRQR